MDLRIARPLATVTLAAMLCPLAWAQAGETLAIVDGIPFTEAEVRALAAEELDRLERSRLQAEASNRAEEHTVLEEALNGMIADRVLGVEAERRGVPVAALLEEEVAGKAPVPTDEEVRNTYDLNREQLSNVSREIGLGRVRDFLIQRNYDQRLEAYVDLLREEYDVQSFLGPYRVEIDTENHPVTGPADAPVTLVEFSDFECPFCRQTEPIMKRIQEEYGEQVRIVYRQFPLNQIHPRAQKAAEASLCAHEQGAFWTMHDELFVEPVELEMASLREKAARVGLDTEAFNECLNSNRTAETVASDIRAGIIAGVSGTPTVFINGRPVGGAQPFEAYTAIIDDELELLSRD